MSADNWAICPRCTKRAFEAAGAELEARRSTRDKEYGAVSVAEFQALLAAVADAERLAAALRTDAGTEQFRTLREDWEIGVFGGDDELFISYRGRCNNCDLTITFKHTESVS